MFQVVDRIGTEAQLVNEGVCCNISILHGFPKRFITDHKHPTHPQDNSIIFCKLLLEHTQRFDYNNDKESSKRRRMLMVWIEADPLPLECENCPEEECYNCDYAGKRWYLSEEDYQKLQQKWLQLKDKRKVQ